jgi:hypothetical protein
MSNDNLIRKNKFGEQIAEIYNSEAEGYVLGGIRYIPLGVTDTDFSQSNASQTIEFMNISDDLDGFAYLSSGQVYNGSSSPVTLRLKSQYVTFGNPSVNLQAGAYFSWTDMPITGVSCSSNSSAITLSVTKYAAKDEFPTLRTGVLKQNVSKTT